MDYCLLCQRHVNGAVSCPGCGGSEHLVAEPPTPGTDTVPLPVVPEEEIRLPAAADAALPPAPAGPRLRVSGGRRRAPGHRHRAAVLAGVAGLVATGFTVAVLGSGGSDPGSDRHADAVAPETVAASDSGPSGSGSAAASPGRGGQTAPRVPETRAGRSASRSPDPVLPTPSATPASSAARTAAPAGRPTPAGTPGASQRPSRAAASPTATFVPGTIGTATAGPSASASGTGASSATPSASQSASSSPR